MTVTEFALIRLRLAYDELDFLEALMQCQEVQDEWVRCNRQHCIGKGVNVSNMFIDKSDPPSLLITAPWNSPEEHGKWIQSTENQNVFGQLSKYIAPGCNSTMLVHLDSAGRQQELSEDFLTQEAFNVSIVEASPGQKDLLQSAYEKLEKDLLALGSKQRIWAGWRIEKMDDSEADALIVFWNNKLVPEDRLSELASVSTSTKLRRFKHVV